MGPIGSHGTQPGPLRRGGDSRVTGAGSEWGSRESCQGKARAAGAGHA